METGVGKRKMLKSSYEKKKVTINIKTENESSKRRIAPLLYNPHPKRQPKHPLKYVIYITRGKQKISNYPTIKETPSTSSQAGEFDPACPQCRNCLCME